LQPHQDQQIEHDHDEHDDQLHSLADDHSSHSNKPDYAEAREDEVAGSAVDRDELLF
jgi:hypothetical protein